MTDRERRYKVYSIEKDKERIPKLNDDVKSGVITAGADALVVAISFLVAKSTGNAFNECMFNLIGVAGIGHGLVYSTACIHSLFKKIGLEKEAQQFESELEEEKGKTK